MLKKILIFIDFINVLNFLKLRSMDGFPNYCKIIDNHYRNNTIICKGFSEFSQIAFNCKNNVTVEGIKLMPLKLSQIDETFSLNNFGV